MQLVSWNCRGLGNPTKAEAIKDLLKMEPTDILMLQERKVEGEILLNTSNTKWKFDSGKVVSARGMAGGIASNLNLALFNMYVPVHYEEKKECWKTLSEFLDHINPRNIVIGGDLNIILDSKEKRGGIYSRDPFLTTVENMILQRDLVDFKLVKGKYTWTSNRIGDNHIAAMLDRFLISSSIMMGKRIVINKILPKLTSDHKPVLLCLKEEEDLGPLPFRFSLLWAEREGFFEIVQTAWRIDVSGSPSYVREQKMKNAKKALKEWIKKPIKTPISQRKEAVIQLEEMQFELEEKDIYPMDLDQEKSAQRNTYSSFRSEEEYWHLKSRSLWLKAGDRNTTYFHRQYRARLT
eukprot:PITA_33119